MNNIKLVQADNEALRGLSFFFKENSNDRVGILEIRALDLVKRKNVIVQCGKAYKNEGTIYQRVSDDQTALLVKLYRLGLIHSQGKKIYLTEEGQTRLDQHKGKKIDARRRVAR